MPGSATYARHTDAATVARARLDSAAEAMAAVDAARRAALAALLATAPANARYASLRIRLQTNGGTDPYVFATDPMMCVVPSGQTEWPAYTPGRTDTLADRTADNTHAVADVAPAVSTTSGGRGAWSHYAAAGRRR